MMNIKKDEKKQFRKNEGDVAGSVSQSSHKSSHKTMIKYTGTKYYYDTKGEFIKQNKNMWGLSETFYRENL